MGKRIWHYAETLAEQNTTVEYPDWEDAASLTFMPKPNSTYLLLATGGVRSTEQTGAKSASYAKFYSPSLDIDFVNYLHFVCFHNSPNKLPPFFCMGLVNFGNNPVEFTCKVAYATPSDDTPVITRDIRIVSIKLEKGDVFTSSQVQQGTTSDDWQDAASLTFTPKSEGNYFVIARATQNPSSQSVANMDTVLEVNNIEYGLGKVKPMPGTGGDYRLSWGTMEYIVLDAEETEIKVKYRSDGTQTSNIQDIDIVALRLSDFVDCVFFEKDDTLQTTRSTTPVSILTLNESFAEGDWFVMTTAHYGGANSNAYTMTYLRLGTDEKHFGCSRSIYGKIGDGFTQTFGSFCVQENYDGVKKPNLAISSVNPSLPTYDTWIQDSRIVAINLDAPYIYPRDQVRISAIDGNAFFDVSEYDTLTDCVGGEYKITVTDSTGKKLIGYIDQTKRGENYE